MENANPTVHNVATRSSSSKVQDPFADILAFTSYSSGDTDSDTSSNYDDEERADPIDAQEVYDLLANITDPEHPLTLSQLAVVNLPHITVHDSSISNSNARSSPSTVLVEITPTIPHCSMAQLIGLCVRVRLERSLPSRFRVDVKVREGTHQSEGQVNKQLADKERVAAACENEQLMGVLGGMMETCV